MRTAVGKKRPDRLCSGFDGFLEHSCRPSNAFEQLGLRCRHAI